MAREYRPVVRDQGFLLPPDMRQWLAEDHPVWLVIRVVDEHLDTSAFHAGRKRGGAGTAGYDPDMLLTVLVWAYAHQVTSSRRMEQLCRTDVAFRVICGGNLPDHSTLARFRSGFPGAVADLFGQVLALCARLGMGRLGTVALDGTKIAASASKAANRTEDTLARLAQERVAAHARADAEEDDLFGKGRRGDEVPREAWSPRQRDTRIAAALAGLRADREAAEQAEQARADEFRERREAGQRTGCSPDSAAAELAEENLARVRAARAAEVAELEEKYAAGQPRRGRPAGIDDSSRVRAAAAKVEKARARAAEAARKAAERARDRKGPVRNITDPDSRLMPVRGGGFIQGYNAQNVTSSDGLIIATRLTQDPADMAWYQQLIDDAQAAAVMMAAHRPSADPGQDQDQDPAQDPGPDPGPDPGQDPGPGGIGLVLADAGYCSDHNLTTGGPDRLIATGRRRDLEKAARGQDSGQDRGGPAIQAMREKLKTPGGITAYRQRGHIAETPHGNIKHNMGFRQLSMRGLPRAAAEWTLACTAHNLFKTLTAGHLTPQALTTQAT